MSTIHVTSSAATTTTTTSLDSDDQSAPRGRHGLLSQFIPLPTSKPSTHGSSSSTHELNQDHDPQHQELNEMHGGQLSDGTQSVLLDDSIQGVLNIDGAQEGSQQVQPNDINQDVTQQDDLVGNENALDSDTNQEPSPESSANQESNDSPSNIHHDDDSVSQASHPTTAGAETEYDFGFDTETIASTTYMNSPPQTTTSTTPTSHLRTPRRRARKPIDMTNLTLLHHLLTTRLSDLQTHHLALLTPPPPPTPSSPLLKTHHTQAYKTSAREIIFLGRGIASSWSPVARGCKDRVLRDSLLLSLQRIDTLSARMKGVLGSVVRFEGGKVDEEGVVVSSAVEVVKAAEDALRDLEAARVMVWEKEEEGEEGVDAGENVGEEEEKGKVDQVKVEEEEEVRVVELTGMEGMEEALKIAMKAASAVGN
ncbi:hypothetical protein BCR33DRAFT_469427 [Rhizoclosmatium globosum]|uniref:Uncharacterized protein n=1 Tax=Rhizoclosmatium globosum TaxID=329046 RepID=A0A1Y2BQR4_9FUNG|nr:hypothetical protein BCR33DRAFT_469427 [Rhizoclosmatium globosum]|eukprot:ORY37074.1 hypothetical protein BCR33DRAFT_469427 [Rhizoclosmatium globosum]